MFCQACGAEIGGTGDKYCSQCGSELVSSSANAGVLLVANCLSLSSSFTIAKQHNSIYTTETKLSVIEREVNMLYAVMKKSYSIDSEISTVLRASAVLMHIPAVACPSVTRWYSV